MALANFLVAGSYTVAKRIMIDADRKSVQIFLDVYTSSSKVSLLQTMSVEANMVESGQIVAVDEDTPPGSPETGDRYHVGTGTGAWDGMSNVLATYNGAAWEFDAVSPRQLYRDDAGDFWHLVDDVMTETTAFGEELWDAAFGVDAQDVVDVNIYSMTYTYLKTLPQFAGVTDA